MVSMARPFLASEHDNVVPDLVALGKGLASGYGPLAGVLVGQRVREVIAGAAERLGAHGKGTILFLDEVPRFNEAQQAALLCGQILGKFS